MKEKVIEFIKYKPMRTGINFGLFLLCLALIIEAPTFSAVLAALGGYIVIATAVFAVDG